MSNFILALLTVLAEAANFVSMVLSFLTMSKTHRKHLPLLLNIFAVFCLIGIVALAVPFGRRLLNGNAQGQGKSQDTPATSTPDPVIINTPPPDRVAARPATTPGKEAASASEPPIAVTPTAVPKVNPEAQVPQVAVPLASPPASNTVLVTVSDRGGAGTAGNTANAGLRLAAALDDDGYDASTTNAKAAFKLAVDLEQTDIFGDASQGYFANARVKYTITSLNDHTSTSEEVTRRGDGDRPTEARDSAILHAIQSVAEKLKTRVTIANNN